MGKIRIYDTQVRAPGPVASPSAPQATPQVMGGDLGQGFKDLGSGITKVGDALQQRAEQSELSDLNAYFAKTQADFTQDWQKRIGEADPSDTTVTSKFMDDFQKHIDDRRDGITTRAGQLFFDRQSAELGSHFQMTANAGQAELAGEKARTDYQSAVSNYSATLLNDPSSFSQVMQQHDGALNNLVSTGLLPQKAALQLREENAPRLAKATVQGWIKLSGTDTQRLDDVEKNINGGTWDKYISGEQKYQLLGEVGTARNAAHTAAERLRMEQKQALEKTQNAKQTYYLQKMFGQGEKFNLQEVLDDKVLNSFGSGSKEQLINMAREHARQGGKLQVDDSLVTDLFKRIHSPETDPQHISNENDLNEFFGKGLDDKWLQTLRGEIQGRKTTDGKDVSDLKADMVRTAEKVLAGPGPTGIVDAEGGANYVRYKADFLKEWDEKVRSGVPVKNLIDPKSPDYMGNKFLHYQKDLPELIDAKARAFQSKPVSNPSMLPTETKTEPVKKQRLPNELPLDYLKRQGLK